MNGERVQSTLDPAAGSAAWPIEELGVVLYAGAAVILAVVCILAIAGVVAGPRRVDARRWLLVGGLVLPGILLVALFIYALGIGHALVSHEGLHEDSDALRIHVTGKQWWWEVRYENGNDAGVLLANELHIPLGQPVEILLGSSDVIHSFWVPALAGKVDMIPGRTTRLVIQADRAGIYRGQCAEYCGAQHALMAFHVVAEPTAEFEAWLAHQARDAPSASDPGLQRGQELFFRTGCAACHAIRGTAAEGRLGPDLTHVGSRQSLGAGTLGNHVGTMAGWIAGTQDLKPGSLMPSSSSLTGPELRALAAWLESLE
jgi:cytochrome c oxidase subunit II